jgi:predicted phage tail protein
MENDISIIESSLLEMATAAATVPKVPVIFNEHHCGAKTVLPAAAAMAMSFLRQS